MKLLIALGLTLSVVACAATYSPMLTESGASSSAKQHNDAGIKHYKMGHWDVAKQHFEEAIQAQPELAQPHYNLGLALHHLGSHQEATAHFKKAAELDSSNGSITNSEVYKRHMRMTNQGSYSGGYDYY